MVDLVSVDQITQNSDKITGYSRGYILDFLIKSNELIDHYRKKIEKKYNVELGKISSHPVFEDLKHEDPNILDAMFCRPDSTIYIPFNERSLELDSLVPRDIYLDELILHELGHFLWWALGGDAKVNSEIDSRRIWTEGFATYCEIKEFLDIYKEGANIGFFNNVPQFYKRGCGVVSLLVKKKGPGTFLKIPSEWRELEKELD